jgi:signal transduction histidine kinase
MKKGNLFFKIIIGFSIIILIFISSTLYINIELNYVNKKLTLLNKGYVLFIKNLSKIQTTLSGDRKILEKIIKDEKTKKNFKLFILNRYKKHPIDQLFAKSLQEINSLLDKNSFYDAKKFYNFAKIELNILQNYYDNNVKACSEYINDESTKENCQNSMNRLVVRVSYLNRVADKKLSELSINLEDILKKITIYNSIFMGLSAIIIVIIFIFLFMLISPIKKLMNAIYLINKGDYSHRVEMNSTGEVAVLVDSFNDMIQVLKNRDEQIKNQQKSLEEHHKNEINIKNKLLEVERLASIGKISAQIAHEIRNPLNSINLNTDIIGDEIFSDDFNPFEIKPLFEHIKIEIERLNSITEKYLRLAKEPDLQLETSDIVKLLNDVFELMSVEFKKKGIFLEKDFKLDSFLLEIDKNIIKSVFINILKNSLEASSKNGSVIVSIDKVLRSENNFLKIIVKDAGIGISDKDKENIFNPFFTTKKYGTGIGLFTVKEGILKHNGEIDFNSEFSKGTEFIIYLPIV